MQSEYVKEMMRRMVLSVESELQGYLLANPQSRIEDLMLRYKVADGGITVEIVEKREVLDV